MRGHPRPNVSPRMVRPPSLAGTGHRHHPAFDSGDSPPNLFVTRPATGALLCYLFPVITDTDRELEKAQALLARVDELTASLQEPGLSKSAQSQRMNEIHRLLDQTAKIMTTVELVFDAVEAEKRNKRLN